MSNELIVKFISPVSLDTATQIITAALKKENIEIVDRLHPEDQSNDFRCLYIVEFHNLSINEAVDLLHEDEMVNYVKQKNTFSSMDTMLLNAIPFMMPPDPTSIMSGGPKHSYGGIKAKAMGSQPKHLQHRKNKWRIR